MNTTKILHATTIYFAAPLFSVAEREFNDECAKAIMCGRPRWNVILPQRRAEAFHGRADFTKAVFDQCLQDVATCDVVVAILDGADVDSGTCIEIGYAFAQEKKIVGVRSDFRGSEDRGVNLMVAASCDIVVSLPSMTATTASLAQRIVEAIEEINSE